jgi:hypothetical protein
MDALTLMLDAVVGIMTALCVGLLAWGGWLSFAHKPDGRDDAQHKAR